MRYPRLVLVIQQKTSSVVIQRHCHAKPLTINILNIYDG